MDGGALFRVSTEAKARVLAEMSTIILHKNEVGGYAYNDATMLITQIERVGSHPQGLAKGAILGFNTNQ